MKQPKNTPAIRKKLTKFYNFFCLHKAKPKIIISNFVPFLSKHVVHSNNYRVKIILSSHELRLFLRIFQNFVRNYFKNLSILKEKR